MKASHPPELTAHSPQADVIDLSASLEHIYISPGHDYWRKPDAAPTLHGIHDVPEVLCIESRGLEGDRYSLKKPGKMGQVTFMQAETVDALRKQFNLPDLPASLFRRNLIVRGATLADLLGKRFTFQGITFEGAQECKPCVWMDRAVADGAQAFLKHPFRGGLRAKVLSTGVLRTSR